MPFKGIQAGKLRRLPGAGVVGNLRGWRYIAWNARDVISILVGTVQALWIVGRYRPAVIFNKSGPPGFPIGIAALFLRVPMVLHEPDVSPGLGTRVMGRWARSIATGFPIEFYASRLQPKLVYTGMPVQPALLQGNIANARRTFHLEENVPVLLVVGGSQGARELNSALVACLPELLLKSQILHVTGKHEAERVGRDVDKLRRTQSMHVYHSIPFLEPREMADAYAVADVVVARAGASTIAELAALEKPTVLVPNTSAAAHQVQNAQALQRADAAMVATGSAQDLLTHVTSLLESAETRSRYSKAIAQFHAPQAANQLADVLLDAGKRS